MKFSIAILVAAVVGLYTFFAKEDARFERAIARTIEPDGCHNEYRGADYNALGGIILFERYCGDSVRRTMNASFVSNQRKDSSSLMPRGPGNVLVLELPEVERRRAFYAGMYGDIGRNGRFVIRYDSTARVISQHPTVDGVTFEFVPTALP